MNRPDHLARELVLRKLLALEPMEQREIVEVTGWPSDEVYNALRRAAARGHLKYSPNGMREAARIAAARSRVTWRISEKHSPWRPVVAPRQPVSVFSLATLQG